MTAFSRIDEIPSHISLLVFPRNISSYCNLNLPVSVRHNSYLLCLYGPASFLFYADNITVLLLDSVNVHKEPSQSLKSNPPIVWCCRIHCNMN